MNPLKLQERAFSRNFPLLTVKNKFWHLQRCHIWREKFQRNAAVVTEASVVFLINQTAATIHLKLRVEGGF